MTGKPVLKEKDEITETEHDEGNGEQAREPDPKTEQRKRKCGNAKNTNPKRNSQAGEKHAEKVFECDSASKHEQSLKAFLKESQKTMTGTDVLFRFGTNISAIREAKYRERRRGNGGTREKTWTEQIASLTVAFHGMRRIVELFSSAWSQAARFEDAATRLAPLIGGLEQSKTLCGELRDQAANGTQSFEQLASVASKLSAVSAEAVFQISNGTQGNVERFSKMALKNVTYALRKTAPDLNAKRTRSGFTTCTGTCGSGHPRR